MGAVGAIAPTVFESMGASTYFLVKIATYPSIFMKKGMETISSYSNSLPKI